MRIRTTLAAAAAAATGLAAAATPALAAPTYSAQSTHTSGGHTIVQAAAGEVLSSSATGKKIAFTCTAAALPDGVATGVVGCYLLGFDQVRYGQTAGDASPGAADAESLVLDVPAQSYRLCVRGTALFLQGTFTLTSPTACSPRI